MDSANFVGATNITLARGADSGGTNQYWRLTFNTDKTINLRRADNSSFITTPPLTNGVATRIEWQVHGGVQGMGRVQVFTGENKIPDYDSGEVQTNFAGNPVNLRWGLGAAGVNVSGAFDDVAWSDTGWIGGVPITIAPKGIESQAAAGLPNTTRVVKPVSIASAQIVDTPVSGKSVIAETHFSDERFGAATAANSVRPFGTPSAQAFGAIKTALALIPKGIATGERFGTPKTTLFVTLSGIPSAQRMGTASVLPVNTVAPKGIVSSERLGTTQSLNTAVVIAVAVGSSEVFGRTAVFGPGSVVSARGIPTAAAMGNAIITQVVKPVSIASAETVNAPKLTRAVTAAGITTSQVVGRASVASALSVAVVGVPGASALGKVTITQTVFPSGIVTAQAFGKPSNLLAVTSPGVPTAQRMGNSAAGATISPKGITSAENVGRASVRLDSIVTPKGIPSSEQIGRTATTQVVKPAGIGSAERFGVQNPHVIGFPQTVTPAGIASAQDTTVGRFIVRIIAPAGIQSVQVVGKASTTKIIAPVTITTAERQGYTHTAQVIAGVGIGSAERFSNVGKAVGINATSISTAAALGVVKASAPVVPRGIESGEKFGRTVVSPGSVTVRPTSVDSAARFGVPLITNGITIRPASITSAQAVGGAFNIYREADVYTDMGNDLVNASIGSATIDVEVEPDVT
jgi:hypothetical protein